MVRRDLFWQAWPIIAKWRKAEVQAKKEMVEAEVQAENERVARQVFQAWGREARMPDLVSSSGTDDEMDHSPWHSSSSSSTDDKYVPVCDEGCDEGCVGGCSDTIAA